jgi:regulator of sigma E protease
MESALNFLYYAAVLILSLSILVVLHEFGHYLPAKLFGMRVEKFYLFFDWPRKLFSFKRGETEWGVGLLPLGGYVKIAGIVDENMDEATMSEPAKPWEFRSKPVWQRMIVMLGGVTMNLILGVVIFIGLKYSFGERRIPIAQVNSYGIDVVPGSFAADLGFRPGDRVLNVNGKEPHYLEDLNSASMFLGQDVYVEIERNGQKMKLPIPNDYINKLVSGKKLKGPIFMPNAPAVVHFVEEGGPMPYQKTPAYMGGLRDGDKIQSIDGVEIHSFGEIRGVLATRKGKALDVLVDRKGEQLHQTVQLDQTGMLGIVSDLEKLIKPEVVQYSPGEAVVVGTTTAFTAIGDNIRGLGKVFRGDADASKSVAGPVKLGKILGDSLSANGIYGYLSLLGMLSMVLAFMNVLPIPALDGGHVVFLLIEGITRREPSLKTRMVIQQIGMVILLCLTVLILVNDIFLSNL